MTLSFREQAVLTLSTSGAHPVEGVTAWAQELADACCKAWGHDEDTETYGCRRCGAAGPPGVAALIEAAQVERDAARNALCDVLDLLGVDDPQAAKREIHRLKAREP